MENTQSVQIGFYLIAVNYHIILKNIK